MKVAEADVEAVVLTVLDELYLGPNGRVEPDVLFQEWPKEGLRTSDLEAALESLHSKGAIVLEESGQGERITLTQAGHDRMLKLNSPLTLGMASYQRLRRTAQRRLLERREAAGSVTEERRRSYHSGQIEQQHIH